ncbi:MAG: hypothetical protein JWN30_1750 [Bacilli bacterium]|nr:hypothetical protein [Bacilli bacterium]
MKKEEIQSYCEKYFTHVGATIVCRSDGYMEIDLPTEIDKELTDRPYYWMWIEATGQTPPQNRLRMQFDPNMTFPDEAPAAGKIELISLGSFRLNKIFESVAKRGRITKQYQISPPQIASQSLEPWLMVPYKVSFIADLRRDEIRSVGVNLLTGEIFSNF